MAEDDKLAVIMLKSVNYTFYSSVFSYELFAFSVVNLLNIYKTRFLKNLMHCMSTCREAIEKNIFLHGLKKNL